MLICGIHDGHNAAACLVLDGRLVGALQEERLRRIKNWSGFPSRAIESLLPTIGVSWRDVDAFVFAGYESHSLPGSGPGDRDAQIHAYKAVCGPMGKVRRLLRKTVLRKATQQFRRQRRIRHLLDCGVPSDRIFMVKHHRCHATTAYYGPGSAQDALVITLDGAGDSLCATVSIPDERGHLKLLASVKEEHSIGILWALITSLMGMVPLEHEYKLMGMAPYANGQQVRMVADRFARAFQMQNGVWTRVLGVPELNYSYEYWRNILEFMRFDHVCAGLQLFTEEFVTAWIQSWLHKTGRRKLRLSGGVFMNVKLNKAIGELEDVDDLYVFPSCGDETNPIGAAWAFLEDHGQAEHIVPLGPLYLGIESTSDAYHKGVEKAHGMGFQISQPTDLADEVADLLAKGEVVARFNGRDEFGARALGNRSILARSSRREVVQTINGAIKCRDFWMPFAPTVMAEVENRYVCNPKRFAAPYMILAFDSRNTNEIIAACHPEDGTIRPQILEREWNPSYHRVLERFCEKTGQGVILNTSFNMHGEPIVTTPVEAVDVLNRSGLRYLTLGDYLIRKDTI
jgi:carbamoyltransferase